jgi:hypothetical protein
MTKQDYASRRDQPECSCPEGKSLPLAKAYPAPGWESMVAPMKLNRLTSQDLVP